MTHYITTKPMVGSLGHKEPTDTLVRLIKNVKKRNKKRISSNVNFSGYH